MPKFRKLHLALPVLVAVAVIAAKPVPRSALGCAPRTAHATAVIATASKTVGTMVRAQLMSLGWSTPPATWIVETRATACDSVIAAHNTYAGGTDPDYRVTTTVILRADHTWLVEVPPSPKRVETIIFVYDSALKFKTIF